jgi:hypothetical protein
MRACSLTSHSCAVYLWNSLMVVMAFAQFVTNFPKKSSEKCRERR